MKRKDDEKDRSCSSRSKLEPIPPDLKMATVTRLPAKSDMKSQNKFLLGGGMKRKERDKEEDDDDDEKEKETDPSKSDFDSLPLDLQMAILTRVRAKTLMNSRCVSKTWSSIIRSQGFIESYFSNSSKQSRFIVALSNGVFTNPEEKLTFFFSFQHDEGEEEHKSSSSSLVPSFEMAIPTTFSHYRQLLASFHGILAVKANSWMMMCNPSMEQVVKLPGDPIASFVGYDPIDDQFKALSCCATSWNDYDGHLEHKVLTVGSGQGWRPIKGTLLPYRESLANVCINGFLYYAAFFTQTTGAAFVRFDVRSEKLSFIRAPSVVLPRGNETVFLEYKGKLASIVRLPYGRFPSFDLWILEDAEKPEWSKHTCAFPSSVWDDIECGEIYFPGTNKAGEIIVAPTKLSRHVRPFYIFYYNVETQNIRRVRLLGIGDSDEFRRSYGFNPKPEDYFVRIAHQHVESLGFFRV
ncbi:PREDICTED: putative F-box protein At1g32660 [Camelina sativa]|uniref:F-box protein At1g32660 n=1 Tax=Camelina sativa TaxID=90675 RepID=A0ABM0X5M9_CAMSA|nr:PREDICTED: putative F-box protein At1g32660 [Camelina sativa]